MSNTRGLHWFRHDLRITDNQAFLTMAQQSDSCLGIYVFDPSWESTNACGCVHLGEHRKTFIEHALIDLRRSLQELGSDLLVLRGTPCDLVLELVDKLNIDTVSFERHMGLYEREDVAILQQSLINKGHDNLHWIEGHSNYLYQEADFPFALENMPDTFSPFRRKVEKYCKPQTPVASLDDLDISLSTIEFDALSLPQYVFKDNLASLIKGEDEAYLGGERAALKRIQDYFYETDGIASYKETRNGLDGWDFSSRLSAFLAHGCVSPRTVLAILKEYEQARTANDSTYWLFFELLWREFFHWQHLKHGARFFAFDGIQAKSPDTHFDARTFEKWCSGNTGYSIVDACMRQLNASGFMSNRGRQLVASCFVHELGLDWRYGAAFFEQQLIDFDVASNWGNWQYLAGVGSDPRGHRQFNLQKQTDIYDPQQAFIRRWLN